MWTVVLNGFVSDFFQLPGGDEQSQGVTAERSYYVPSRLRECPDQEDLLAETNASVAFFITFNGFLPGE